MQKERNKKLDASHLSIKSQEYINSNLEFFAYTCISLSTQSTEVLDQALLKYTELIELGFVNWPLGLTPSTPEGTIEKGLYAFFRNTDEIVIGKRAGISCGKYKYKIMLVLVFSLSMVIPCM